MHHLILFAAMFFSAASFAQLTKEVGSFNELKVYDGLSVTLISSTENKD